MIPMQHSLNNFTASKYNPSDDEKLFPGPTLYSHSSYNVSIPHNNVSIPTDYNEEQAELFK